MITNVLSSKLKNTQCGLSVVEVLVGMAVLITSMVAMGTIFVNSSQTVATTKLIESANLLTEQVLEKQMQCRSLAVSKTYKPYQIGNNRYNEKDLINKQLEVQVNHKTIQSNLDEINIQVYQLNAAGARGRLLTDYTTMISVTSIKKCSE